MTTLNNTNVDPMVRVHKETKEQLDRIKLIPEESYNSVVRRLLVFFKEHEDKKEEGSQ